MTQLIWQRNRDHVLRVRKAGQDSSADATQEKARGVPAVQRAPFQIFGVTVAEQHPAHLSPQDEQSDFHQHFTAVHPASGQPDSTSGIRAAGQETLRSLALLKGGAARLCIRGADRGQFFPTYTRNKRCQECFLTPSIPPSCSVPKLKAVNKA